MAPCLLKVSFFFWGKKCSESCLRRCVWVSGSRTAAGMQIQESASCISHLYWAELLPLSEVLFATAVKWLTRCSGGEPPHPPPPPLPQDDEPYSRYVYTVQIPVLTTYGSQFVTSSVRIHFHPWSIFPLLNILHISPPPPPPPPPPAPPPPLSPPPPPPEIFLVLLFEVESTTRP